VEKAGLENAGPYCRGGKRGTGKRGTRYARVENAGPPCMEPVAVTTVSSGTDWPWPVCHHRLYG